MRETSKVCNLLRDKESVKLKETEDVLLLTLYEDIVMSRSTDNDDDESRLITTRLVAVNF